MGWRRIFYGLTFPILGAAAADPDSGLDSARHPAAARTRTADHRADIPGGVLRHHPQYAAGRASRSIRSISVPPARSASARARSSRTSSCRARLPYIFVGLQIAMGACWFSLVASEIVSGQAGLGYKVWETYYYVQFETMVIIMATLGFLGYVSSALVRIVGNRLMRWRVAHAGGRVMAWTARGGALSIRHAGKVYDPERRASVVALDDVSFDTRAGRILCRCRPFGLRQDHAAQCHRRIRPAHLRRNLSRRRTAHLARQAAAARRRPHGRVSERCAVSLEDRALERHLRPDPAGQDGSRRAPSAGARIARPRRAATASRTNIRANCPAA